MDTTTSWLSDRIASIVPSMLPQAVAHAEAIDCFTYCSGDDSVRCCYYVSVGLWYCSVFANC